MTNKEKYKSVEERETEFDKFCGKQKGCDDCQIHDTIDVSECILEWLNLDEEDDKEENDMFEEVILWHKVKRRPMTEEEKREYEKMGINEEYIYECVMPEDGQDILVKTRYGVSADVACNDNFIRLEGRWNDWDDVEYWAEMPKGEK